MQTLLCLSRPFAPHLALGSSKPPSCLRTGDFPRYGTILTDTHSIIHPCLRKRIAPASPVRCAVVKVTRDPTWLSPLLDPLAAWGTGGPRLLPESLPPRPFSPPRPPHLGLHGCFLLASPSLRVAVPRSFLCIVTFATSPSYPHASTSGRRGSLKPDPRVRLPPRRVRVVARRRFCFKMLKTRPLSTLQVN